MVYRGRVEKGMVVLEEGVVLPDGTEVRVEPVPDSVGAQGGGGRFLDEMLKIAETMNGLPSDLARNHDHYIHGQPRE